MKIIGKLTKVCEWISQRSYEWLAFTGPFASLQHLHSTRKPFVSTLLHCPVHVKSESHDIISRVRHSSERKHQGHEKNTRIYLDNDDERRPEHDGELHELGRGGLSTHQSYVMYDQLLQDTTSPFLHKADIPGASRRGSETSQNRE